MIHVNNKFAFGDVVQLVCSDDDVKGVVVAVTLAISGSVSYSVSWGNLNESAHYHQELALVEAVEQVEK